MKKKVLTLLTAFLFLLSMTACRSQDAPENSASAVPSVSEEVAESTLPETEQNENEGSETHDPQEIMENNTMNVIVGDATFTATLVDNSSAQALVELLQEGPLTIEMNDYGNMEKVGPIGQTLPANDEQITTEPGDIILYQSNSLVIYYDTNSWNFTRIGKINYATQEELLDALGSGAVSVTFALSDDESRS